MDTDDVFFFFSQPFFFPTPLSVSMTTKWLLQEMVCFLRPNEEERADVFTSYDIAEAAEERISKMPAVTRCILLKKTNKTKNQRCGETYQSNGLKEIREWFHSASVCVLIPLFFIFLADLPGACFPHGQPGYQNSEIPIEHRHYAIILQS